MRINSIYISAFGKIKDLKLDFSDNFNVVYGENENGKTTIMSFIKMMFYGSERASGQISKNIRKKYTPWDSSQMAGSIDFEYNGKSYRLEREFKGSNSTDRVTLCDLALGDRQSVSADVGKSFFGLSAQSFERSVFIGQLGFPEKDSQAEGEINAKLSNIALTGDEDVSFEEVSSKLSKAKLSLMSKSGKAGQYDKNVKAASDLRLKIENAKKLSADNEREKATILMAEEKIALMQKNADTIKNKLDLEKDIRNAEKLKEYLALKTELDNINSKIKLSDGSVLDEMFLNKLKFCISKVQAASQKKKAKQNEIETLKKSLEIALSTDGASGKSQAEALEKELINLENNKNETKLKIEKATKETTDLENKGENKPPVYMLTAAFCFFASALAFSFALDFYLPSILLGLAAILMVVSYFISKKKQSKKAKETSSLVLENKKLIEELQNEIKVFDNQIFDTKVKLETINSALNSSTAVIENQQKMLSEASGELNLLSEQENSEEKVLFELFARFKKSEDLEEILKSVEEITSVCESQKDIKTKLNFLARDLGDISYEEAENKLNSLPSGEILSEEDFKVLKQKYEDLAADITAHKTAVASAKATLNAALNRAEDISSLNNELLALENKINAQKDFCDSIDIALSVLSESFAEVRKSYGSELEKVSGEIFALLSGGKYESMGISKEFDINVSEKDKFGSREIDYLSSGTADQAYLSLRLALAKLITEDGESLPILLDDTLAQYDDKRAKSALEFLSSYSNDSQIILFTCHNSFKTLSEGLGAEILVLEK
ncbi:MAG: AAA family ATPase [Clostridia bacterium]|nr:AAA family ATPase [Clostridia bacterium]